MPKTVDVYTKETPENPRFDEREYYECECGEEQLAESRTECKPCGAHYTRQGDVMVQVAPPIQMTN